MTYIRWQRIRLKAKPEKCGMIEAHDTWGGCVRVKWDVNRWHCRILESKIELDPAHEEHNAKLRSRYP